jgi:hypothetical protein
LNAAAGPEDLGAGCMAQHADVGSQLPGVFRIGKFGGQSGRIG